MGFLFAKAAPELSLGWLHFRNTSFELVNNCVWEWVSKKCDAKISGHILISQYSAISMHVRSNFGVIYQGGSIGSMGFFWLQNLSILILIIIASSSKSHYARAKKLALCRGWQQLQCCQLACSDSFQLPESSWGVPLESIWVVIHCPRSRLCQTARRQQHGKRQSCSPP